MTQALYEKLRSNTSIVAATDPVIAEIIEAERNRQSETLCLIPSENYVSSAVAAALSSPFTNKYSEGYPYVWKDGEEEDKNGRYYQGQEFANRLEKLAIERALDLFTDDPSKYHANVQPLSGAPANLAVLNALLKPGDTFMGLSLDDGGHLTHGHKVSLTSKIYTAVQYHLNEKGELDYDGIAKLAEKTRPKLIVCGATAYPLQIDFKKFGEIATSVGALLMADIAHIAGLCVAGVHPHPFPYADVVTSTTHKILRGPRAGIILCKKELGQKIDTAVFPGLQGGPHMNVVGAMAVAFKEALKPAYRGYAAQVVKNARVLATSLQEYGFVLVGGGTENHLILIDIVHSAPDVASPTGNEYATHLEQVGIVANKNAIPGDAKPWIPSGVRLGTPAITSLGMKEPEMKQVAIFMAQAAQAKGDEEILRRLKQEVKEFVAPFLVNLP